MLWMGGGSRSMRRLRRRRGRRLENRKGEKGASEDVMRAKDVGNTGGGETLYGGCEECSIYE